MLALVNNLVLAGYTASQILNFVSKKVNGLSQGIQTARSSGHVDEDILKFLSGKIKTPGKSDFQDMANDQDKYLTKIGLKTKAQRAETRNKFLKGALGIGAGALAAYQGYRMASNALNPPQATTPPTAFQLPGPGAPPPGAPPGPTIPIQGTRIPPPGPMPQPQTPQPQPIVPTAPAQRQPNPSSLAAIQSSGFGPLISSLAKQNIPAAGIVSALNKLGKGQAFNTLAKGLGQTAEQLIEDFVSLAASETASDATHQNQRAVHAMQQPPSALGQSPEQTQISQEATEEPAQPIEALSPVPISQAPKPGNKPVLLPSGHIGTIRSVKDGIASIDTDEGVKTRKLSDLIISDEDKDSLVQTYRSLVNQMPPEWKSNWIWFANYDYKHNIFHWIHSKTGKLYSYENVEPEFVKRLASLGFRTKTSGGSEIKPYEIGDQSTGAGISELVQEMKTRREMPEQKNFRSAEPVFDFMKHPRDLYMQDIRKKELQDRKKKKSEKETKPLANKKMKKPRKKL